MPTFTVEIGPDGPVVDVEIGVSAGRARALTKERQGIPKKIKIKGLLDTGASCTCVDGSILKQLALEATGQTPVSTPSTGETPHNTDEYDISLVILPPDDQIPFERDTVGVVEGKLHSGQSFQALIGRDILQGCLLCYYGNKNFLILSY